MDSTSQMSNTYLCVLEKHFNNPVKMIPCIIYFSSRNLGRVVRAAFIGMLLFMLDIDNDGDSGNI